jgi:DeoR/GlpR family transcriptional regulator of sugar metabolism
MKTEDPPLIPEQRRALIVQHLGRDSVLSYRQLATAIGVSHMTIRRDIAALEAEGRVVAMPGGAKLGERLAAEPPRSAKYLVDIAEKRSMSRHAASLVRESMTIYLDAGTSLQPMRAELEKFVNLTIVTNDLVIAASYIDHPTIDIITVGGRLDKENQSTVGRLPSLVFAELNIDIAFLTSSSWDLARGITIPGESKVDPKKAAMRAATTTVLVAASSKYGTFARYRVAELGDVDRIITDDSLPLVTAEAIEAQTGTAVVRVSP